MLKGNKMKNYPRAVVIYGANKVPDEVFTVLEKDLVPQAEYDRLVEKRKVGELTGNGMYLPGIFDWHIVRDRDEHLVLIATRKLA